MVELWVSAPDLRKNLGYVIFGGVIMGMSIAVMVISSSFGGLYQAIGGVLGIIIGVYLMRSGMVGVRDLWEVKLLEDKAPVSKKEKSFVAEKVA